MPAPDFFGFAEFFPKTGTTTFGNSALSIRGKYAAHHPWLRRRIQFRWPPPELLFSSERPCLPSPGLRPVHPGRVQKLRPVVQFFFACLHQPPAWRSHRRTAFLLLDAIFPSRRTSPLTLIGPPGLQARFRLACEVFYPGSMDMKRAFELNFIELEKEEKTAFSELGLAITAFAVEHFSGSPSYALRFSRMRKHSLFR